MLPAPPVPAPRHLALLLFLALVIGLNLGCLSLDDCGLFEYRRSLIAQGQWWRLVSGHLVHLGWGHFLLNLAGLLLLLDLTRDWLGLPRALLVLIVSMASISAGLWYAYPDIAWYRGLSGALHGLWAAGAVAGMRQGSRIARALAAILALKLLAEALGLDLLQHDFPVLHQAHWLGAGGGLLAALAHLRRPDENRAKHHLP